MSEPSAHASGASTPLDSDASSLAPTADPVSRRSGIGQLTNGELRAFVLSERRAVQEREEYYRAEVRVARERAKAAEAAAVAAEVRAAAAEVRAARVRAEASEGRGGREAAAAIERARADAALRRTCCAIA